MVRRSEVSMGPCNWQGPVTSCFERFLGLRWFLRSWCLIYLANRCANSYPTRWQTCPLSWRGVGGIFAFKQPKTFPRRLKVNQDITFQLYRFYRYFSSMVKYIPPNAPLMMIDHWGSYFKPQIVWVVVSKIFYFHPYLGRSILTNVFQMGWNHQLVVYLHFCYILYPILPSILIVQLLLGILPNVGRRWWVSSGGLLHAPEFGHHLAILSRSVAKRYQKKWGRNHQGWFGETGFLKYQAGQIIATSHDLTPNGGLVREIPLFQGNPGWWNIIIWPDQGWFGKGPTTLLRGLIDHGYYQESPKISGT